MMKTFSFLNLIKNKRIILISLLMHNMPVVFVVWLRPVRMPFCICDFCDTQQFRRRFPTDSICSLADDDRARKANKILFTTKISIESFVFSLNYYCWFTSSLFKSIKQANSSVCLIKIILCFFFSFFFFNKLQSIFYGFFSLAIQSNWERERDLVFVHNLELSL